MATATLATPACQPSEATGKFSVWIIEGTAPGRATMAPAGVETRDYRKAAAWVDGFNSGENETSFPFWAIIRHDAPQAEGGVN